MKRGGEEKVRKRKRFRIRNIDSAKLVIPIA